MLQNSQGDLDYHSSLISVKTSWGGKTSVSLVRESQGEYSVDIQITVFECLFCDQELLQGTIGQSNLLSVLVTSLLLSALLESFTF